MTTSLPGRRISRAYRTSTRIVSYPPLRERLLSAVRKIEIPVFLIQPPKDASLEPSYVLGREFRRLGKTYRGKIYPPEMPEDQQGHCFGGAKGMHVWAQDVLAFLAGAAP